MSTKAATATHMLLNQIPEIERRLFLTLERILRRVHVFLAKECLIYTPKKKLKTTVTGAGS